MFLTKKETLPTKKIVWKDIKVGDSFVDGSSVKDIHEHHMEWCYELYIKGQDTPIVLSADHLLLMDLSRWSDKDRKQIMQGMYGRTIPVEVDQHIWFAEEDENGMFSDPDKTYVEYEVSKEEPYIVDENHVWLSVYDIFRLYHLNKKLICNGKKISKIGAKGQLEVFCVSTTTGKYEEHGLIHHNSVMLRNIIFHCLTHSNDIAIALIDFKQSEFEAYKGVKGVVAVANTTQEAVEVFRIARNCMYKRNKEIAKRKVQNIDQIKPTKPTDKIFVAGRTLQENTKIKVRIDGEEQEMTAAELEEYLHTNT